MSKKLNTAVGMSCAVTAVMVIATAVTWPVYTYVLVPNDLSYLQTIVFILIHRGARAAARDHDAQIHAAAV